MIRDSYAPKKWSLLVVGSAVLLLAGCGATTNTNTVRVQQRQLDIPTTYVSVSQNGLDQARVASSVLAARKDSKTSLILAEWTLAAVTSIQEFVAQSQQRLSQEILGYAKGSTRKKSLSCKDEKLPWYIMTFQQTDPWDPKKIATYVSQFYVQKGESVYVLSLADAEENSILSNIAGSMECVQ